MNSIFYVGIVENRMDPLKLGRVQVRVFGVHSESLKNVPTVSLPWAIVLGSTTSASISGVGETSAIQAGSMVSLYFQDGESKQQPVIMGTIPGVPIAKSSWTKKIENVAEVFTQEQTPVAVETVSSDETVANNSFSDTDYTTGLKAALGKRESSNNYRAVNRLNYLGKYQMGAAMLTDLGYVKRGTTNRQLDDPENWTGKGGIDSKEDFLANTAEQEKAMDAELVLNEKRLTRMGVTTESSTAQERAGFLATAHLLGTGGARDMSRGTVKTDANGVTGNEYYSLGYESVTGQKPVIAPDSVSEDNPSRQPTPNGTIGRVISQNTVPDKTGFEDPSGRFPRYLGEQDTNRLARNQNIAKTIVPFKESTMDRGVKIANSSATWDQSQVPYNAKYPYNQVYETECGHIEEYDSTPGNERTHSFNASGTFTETDKNGTTVRKIVGDSYEIIERNGYAHIKGKINITVEGSANILVQNNCELEVGGNFNASIGGDMNWAVGGNIKVKSEGNNSTTAGGKYAVDAGSIWIQSGKSDAGELSTRSKNTSGEPNFPPLVLEARGFEILSEFESDELDDDSANERQRQLQEAGLIDENIIPAEIGKKEEIEKNTVQDETVECEMFKPGMIDINSFVSPNYRLTQLTRGQSIVSQAGLKDTEIACNLKNLAVNVLEKVKAKYPGLIITSCLRAPGSNPNSQHPKGQAVDLQFQGYSSADYINIAKDLAATIPYDQLILEYRTNKRVGGAPTTWIHISYSSSGNRKQLFTMDNDKRVSNFSELVLLK